MNWKTEEIRKAIAEHVSEGMCGQAVLDSLLQGPACAPVEGDLLDYKLAVATSDPIAVAELCKDIVAFHNSYGGYLVVGVRELDLERFEIVGVEGPLDAETIKNKLRDYTGERIAIRQEVLRATRADGVLAHVSLIYVPQRSAGTQPVHFLKDGPGKGPKAVPVFRVEDIWYRESDECRKATAAKVFEIGAVRSHPLLSESIKSSRKPLERIGNNLPDRSIICPEVVGRRAALDQLWRWLADDLSHVKVLAGMGGIGKSTVAYEFADQVTLLGDNPFSQVVWLSAKAKQFRPIRDTYEEMLETHFSSYDELIDTLCEHLAVIAEERKGATSNKKLRLVKHGLQFFPSLIVIDDVDSLPESEQRQALEIGMLLGGTQSKLLLTTRKNISYSSDICYDIRGLEFEEFKACFDALFKRFPSPLRSPIKDSEVKQIWQGSNGSPLYAESILRLLGYQTVGEALKQWRNESGDAVRKAALQREITQLMPEGKRVLLALARLGEASVGEIAEVTGYSREKVTENLGAISSLFLIDAPRLGPEARIRLSDTTCRVTLSIESELTTDATRLERKVRELRHAAQTLSPKGNETVASAIRQAATLEREGKFDDAIATLRDALRRVGNAKGSDLLAYVGYLLFKASPKDVNGARNACRQAYQGGARKKKLFETWFDSEWEASNFVGAEECARAAIDSRQAPEFEWRIRLAAGLASKASEQSGGKLGINVLGTYLEASEELTAALSRCPTADVARWKPNLEDINDAIWVILRGSSNSAVECYANAGRMAALIEGGDVRVKNYSRLMELVLLGVTQEVRRTASGPRGDFSSEAQIENLERLYQARLTRFPEDDRHPALADAMTTFRQRVERIRSTVP